MRVRLSALLACVGALCVVMAPEPARASAAGEGAAEPSKQALVFYNARIALRENRPNDVLKLWLLRNSLRNRGEPIVHDAEFRSVVWAALGKQGFCQDGFREDADGAGLWPLALHNWALLHIARGPAPDEPPPWDTFQVARQQRFVSLNDVLDAEELRSVTFHRTSCLRPLAQLMDFGRSPMTDLSDRLEAAIFLQRLLELSKTTLVREKVESLAVIDARLFDLDLVIAELRARKAGREAREQAQQARSVGVSREAATEMRETLSRFPEGTPQAVFLRQTLAWRPDEWLSLSKPRRLFLFRQARPLSQDEAQRRALVIGIVDLLIDRKEGEELQSWLGFLEAAESADLRAEIFRGDRGARLLELEPEPTGFRERSVIALHRGVAFLEEGNRQEALRSFAYALKHAEESRESSAVTGLARRWLSYVLSRYETTDDVIATLKALVPRQEYNAVVSDLVWRAALRSDQASFERVTSTVRKGTAFDAHIERLEPLAKGNAGALALRIRKELADEPYAVLRFLRLLVEKLESEDPDVRTAHIPTMRLLLNVMRPLSEEGNGKPGAHARVAAELSGRVQAVLDGLSELDDSGPGRASALSPRSETFAGAIRLAPSDALPWPFRAPQVESPTVFAPMVLTPVEWRDAKGARVWGWRLSE